MAIDANVQPRATGSERGAFSPSSTLAPELQHAQRPSAGLWRDAGRRLSRDRAAMVGLAVIALLVVLAILAQDRPVRPERSVVPHQAGSAQRRTLAGHDEFVAAGVPAEPLALGDARAVEQGVGLGLDVGRRHLHPAADACAGCAVEPARRAAPRRGCPAGWCRGSAARTVAALGGEMSRPVSVVDGLQAAVVAIALGVELAGRVALGRGQFIGGPPVREWG